MLGLFINKKIDENTVLEKPRSLPLVSAIHRPELSLYDIQKQSLDVQDKLITAKNQPRVGLFLQTGYGKPALNFLKNQFETYYLGGLRVSWSLACFSKTTGPQLQELNRHSLIFKKNILLNNLPYRNMLRILQNLDLQRQIRK